MDILATTPRRIADLLCPEMTDAELRSIRRRMHDTVVLSLRTHSSAHAASFDDESSEIPVSAAARGHETEQFKNASGRIAALRPRPILDGHRRGYPYRRRGKHLRIDSSRSAVDISSLWTRIGLVYVPQSFCHIQQLRSGVIAWYPPPPAHSAAMAIGMP
jgi:hypothetical protein